MAITAPPRAPERAPQPAPRRRRWWLWLLAIAVGFVVVVVVSFMAVFGGVGGFPCLFTGGGGVGSGGVEPSSTAVSEIPPEYLRVYRQMGDRYDVDWTILAAIGAQESNHGANAVTSSAGCIGVMQLCGAFTTAPIAQDGNADGDIQLDGTVDIADSIASAANGLRKLKNAPPAGSSYAQYRPSVCAYYGACADSSANYADEVMARAVQYGFSGAGAPAPTNPDTGPADPGPQRTLLNLGDSLAVGAGGPLPDALSGWTVDTDAQTNRPTAAGVARLEARGEDDLPSVLAISLGTNDSPSATAAFRRNVERVLEIAGTNRCVLWAEIRRPPENGVSYSGLNGVLRDVATSHPNLHIVNATGELASDRVHLTPAGYRTRADAIAEAARSCIAALDPSAAAAGATSGNCGGATGGAGGLEGIGSADALALSTNPNITWAHSLPQTTDLRTGRVSPRLVSLLSLIAERHKITVTALASDHSPGSNHEAGRAVDIAIVDNDNCFPPDKAGACWELAQSIDRIKGILLVTEEIYFYDPGPSPHSFAKADHDDHIHAGYDGPLGPKHYDPDVTPASPEAITGSGG